MRETFGRHLAVLGARCKNVVVCDGDLCTSTKASYFRDAFPKRFIQGGIAEQHLIGMAGGLALAGWVPVVNTFSVFACKRAYEQLSLTIAYPKANVKICGGYGGLSSGKAGVSHLAIEDLALMRLLPHFTVIAPADDFELTQALDISIATDGPIYIRIARNSVPPLFTPTHQFAIGPTYQLRAGNDLVLVATGTATSRACHAAHLLAQAGIDATVIHVPTIKPLDPSLLLSCAYRVGSIATIEDHSTIGGLGGVIAECLTEHGIPIRLLRLGIPDRFGASADENRLLELFDLTSEGISRRCHQWLRSKAR